MTNINSSQEGWFKRFGIFSLFFVLALMAFAILPLSALLPFDILRYVHTGLTASFLVAALYLRRSENGKQYWEVFYVFFVAGFAVLLSTLFSGSLLTLFGLTATNPQGIAVAKLSESIFRVIPILILMAIIGTDRRSMYLNKGKIGVGLSVGIAAFIVLAIIAFLPLASQEGMLNKLISLSPWILIFVLSNGFMEELLFRGLFLKRYERFLGKGLSNLLTAIVFTLLHIQVTYVSEVFQFLLITFPLALIWGYLMQKTNSIWGSALFHAGADCLIIFGIYASM